MLREFCTEGAGGFEIQCAGKHNLDFCLRICFPTRLSRLLPFQLLLSLRCLLLCPLRLHLHLLLWHFWSRRPLLLRSLSPSRRRRI
jgi:hypothetical protein